MGVLTIIFFFAGVTVAVSTVGPIVRTVAAVVSLASAVLADAANCIPK